jgi:hypothetical protein
MPRPADEEASGDGAEAATVSTPFWPVRYEEEVSVRNFEEFEGVFGGRAVTADGNGENAGARDEHPIAADSPDPFDQETLGELGVADDHDLARSTRPDRFYPESIPRAQRRFHAPVLHFDPSTGQPPTNGAR